MGHIHYRALYNTGLSFTDDGHLVALYAGDYRTPLRLLYHSVHVRLHRSVHYDRLCIRHCYYLLAAL